MYMYKLDNVITFNQECNVKAILKKKKIPTHVKLGVSSTERITLSHLR